jgi:8-oxo-dGTP pyrophosphatase MutT (NUDIX family)/phosphohistidine phosphatase SixA
VWRRAETARDGGVEVAVIHRPRYGDWSLPKGKLAPGEPEVEGAVREVLEETGYHVRVGRPLGETRYDKLVGKVARPKVVRWWAMQATTGAFTPSSEVDDLRWTPLSEAEQLLTRDTDRDLLRRFAQGPAPTRTVLLIHHASAGSRSRWTGEDRERPLDECGEAQADELVRLLARFDVARITSADVTRCLDTVAPFADAVGLTVEIEPLLSEISYPGREAEAAALLRSTDPDRDAVACSQGDVIPDLVGRLLAWDDVDCLDPMVSAKGSVWALTFSADRVVNAEYFPAPRPVECMPPEPAAEPSRRARAVARR